MVPLEDIRKIQRRHKQIEEVIYTRAFEMGMLSMDDAAKLREALRGVLVGIENYLANTYQKDIFMHRAEIPAEHAFKRTDIQDEVQRIQRDQCPGCHQHIDNCTGKSAACVKNQ